MFFIFSFPDSIRQNPLYFSKYALNRKSETYVPLNTLLGIRYAMNCLQIQSRINVQIRERYMYAFLRILEKQISNKVL